MEVDEVTGLPVIEKREQQRRRRYIKTLRDYADWLEAHPSFWHEHIDGIMRNIFCRDLKEFMALRRAGGLEDKHEVSDYIYFTKDFGSGMSLDLNITKDISCERVQVGEDVTPAKPERTVILAAEPEKRTPIYEWKCPESFVEKASS